MTEHTRDFSMQMNADADPAARRAFVGKWIARNQRRLAAGLGSTVLMLPLLAHAAADAVNALDISGVRAATLNPDGSAQLTLANGQQVQVGASSVQVAADGTILISAAAAELVAEAAAGVAAAGAGTGGAGLGGGAAVAGAIAGIGLAAAAGGGSSESADPAPPPLAPTPVLNVGTFSSASPQTTEEIFGTTFPELEAGDRLFVRFGAEGAETEVTVNADGTVGFPADLDLSGLQGTQVLSYRVARAAADADDVTGSAEVVIDTIPPVITITTPIAGDNVLNAAEQGADLVIEGTATGVEDGQLVRVTFAGGVYRVPVSGEAWSVTVPADVLAGLADGASLVIGANVSDAAGNPAATATATLTTDFTAGITLDPVAVETLNQFTGLEITGTTTGVEADQEVLVNFADQEFTAAVGADGTWSVAIPAAVIESLADGAEVAVSAAVADVAGNQADAAVSSTVDFSTPALVITAPEGGGFVNAAAAAEGLAVSGSALEGQVVTVALNGAEREVTAGADNTWSTSFDAADLPAADGDFTITASTVVEGTAITAPAVTLTLDTTPPVLGIDPVAGDNVLNAAEQGADLVISGTAAGAEDGQEVRVTFAGGVYRVPVTDGVWSVTIPADVLAGLDDGASLVIGANVTDAAGNPAPTATATLATDFTAGIALDPVAIGTLNQFTGLVVSGGTTGVEEGQEVLVGFAGQEFTTTVGADGIWSVLIPAEAVAALDDGEEVALSAAVADVAGNQADAAASSTVDFSTPALVITAPEGGGFVNAADAAAGLTVSGVALEGSEVTVTLNGATRMVTAGADNTWSTGFDAADMPAADGDFTITATTTIEGTPIAAPEVTLTLDTTAPELTLETAVTADGLALSGTASPDVDAVALTVGAAAFTAPVSGGTWSLTIAAGDLPAAASGASVTVTANAVDRAGNPAPAASVDLTAASLSVDAPADGFVVGLDVFENGFTISGASTGAAEGATVTITIVDGPDDADGYETTATVGADGSWSVAVPASDVQGVADQESFTLTAAVQGNEYPAPATASIGISTDIPPQITVDPIGEDGVLILSDLGDTIDLSGTTRGVQQGQTVIISDAGGAELGTATVGADGAWSTSVPTFPIGPGEVVSATFEVANASGRAATSTGTVEGYAPADYMIMGATTVAAGAAAGALEFAFFLDPRTELAGDFGIAFGEAMSFNTGVVSWAPSPAPQYITGVTPAVNTDNLAVGEVTFGGVGFLNPEDAETGEAIDLYGERLIRFRLNHDDTGEAIVLDFTSQVGGSYQFILGTGGDDAALVARPVDSVIRGLGGDDTINVSAAGVNTVLFEADAAANGKDVITGFTTGGALADRIGIVLEDQGALRGDGTQFEVVAAGDGIGGNTGLVVFTTSLDTDAEGIAALDALGLGADDIVYVLAGDDEDTELVRIVMGADGSLPAVDDIEVLAVFEGMGEAARADLGAANFLNFAPIADV